MEPPLIVGSTVTMSQVAAFSASGIGISFYNSGVITSPGQINWDQPISIRVIGSNISYTIAANPTSTDISLADDEVAYITLVRDVPIGPNLIFTTGSDTVTSVGSVVWTSGLLPGDAIKLAADNFSGYYQIQTVNSGFSVTLTTPVLVADNTSPGSAPAEYAFGSYSAAPTPSTNRNIYVAPRDQVPVNGDVFWLFLREDNGGADRVYIRFLAQELDYGESVNVSGTTSLELLQYIGSPGAYASRPQYVTALSPGALPQITDFNLGAGSTITGGQYFLINSSANANMFAVWFKVSGVGTQPVVPYVNNYLEVDILSTDSASAVASKLALALNTSGLGDFSAVAGTEYLFTTSPANATVGATYTNNGQTFTVVSTIAGGVMLVTTGTGAPALSGSPRPALVSLLVMLELLPVVLLLLVDGL